MFKRVILAVIGLSSLVLMSGCADKTPYTEAAVEVDKAVVYVYRPKSYFNEMKVYHVYIGGELKGKLYDNGYLPIEIDPGTTAITVKNSDIFMAAIESSTINLVDVKVGTAHYIKVDVPQQDVFSATAVGAATAKDELAKTVLYDADAKKINIYSSRDEGAQSRTAPVQQKTSSVDKLEKLFKLKEKGALSDEEFEAMKAKIIAE